MTKRKTTTQNLARVGMNDEKYYTCKHSTGKVGELIVYVKPSCPKFSMIKGTICSSKMRCGRCDRWEERK